MSKTPEQRIAELEEELADAESEINDLKGEVSKLESEIEDAETPDYYDSDDYVFSTILSEVRRLIHRQQYADAIELADRELPSRYRYAT